jgi:hypothetical protein
MSLTNCLTTTFRLAIISLLVKYIPLAIRVRCSEGILVVEKDLRAFAGQLERKEDTKRMEKLFSMDGVMMACSLREHGTAQFIGRSARTK